MPLRSLAADDIFISYTRRDASTYAAGLATELTKKGFSCFIDKLGTDPNANLPDMLKRKIRSCAMLVVVCTEWSGTRETIEEEIAEFLRTGRRTSIVPVDFGEAVYKARWYKLIEGVAPEPEKKPDALDDGNPSPSVVSRIEKQFNYTRRNVRLRRVTYATATVLAVLVLASIVASVYAARQLEKAQVAGAEAARARTDADAAKAQAKEEQAKAEAAGREAREAQDRADKARGDADKARAEADQAKEDATEQKRLATVAAADAREKARLAAEATRRAQLARAEADRQQLIGDSRSIASRSQALLRRNPEQLARSVTLAVGALKKSHTVEADTALRESVAVLPHLRRREVYAGDEGYVPTALSPDGRHFASILNKTLRIYEAGGQSPLKELPCDCGEVALSNGPAYAVAAATDGLRILDLRNGGSRVFEPADGVELDYEKFALSPGGRYFAHAFSTGEIGERVSHVQVIDLRSGKAVKRLAEGFDMLINDIAFGPTGILAVGGRESSSEESSFGRVVIWPLKYESEDGAGESLIADSFAPQLTQYHDQAVYAVAPGLSESTYATDSGVWRAVRRNLYEPVAHIPSIGTEPIAELINEIRRSNYEVGHVAFSPRGDRLTIVRQRMEGENGRTVFKPQLEVWDSAGHQETGRAYERDVAALAFRPGGRFVVAHVNQSEKPLHVFDAESGAKVEGDAVSRLANDMMSQRSGISPDLRFVLTLGEGAAQLLDTREAKTATVPFANVLSAVSMTALSPDAAFVALAGKARAEGGGELVVVYRRSAGDVYAEWHRVPLDRSPSGIELSADGRHLAVDSSKVQVWDVERKRDVTPEGLRRREQVRSLKFSPGGRFVAAMDFSADVTLPHDVRVWRLADGKEFEPLTHTKGDALYLFSPDDRFLVVAGRDRLTRLVDLSTGRVETISDDTRNQVVAFSPDGSLLGVGSDEGVVEVYAAGAADAPVARLRHAKAINALAFSEDNRRLATASGLQGTNEVPDGWENVENFPIRFWLLRPEDLIAEAQARLDALPRDKR